MAAGASLPLRQQGTFSQILVQSPGSNADLEGKTWREAVYEYGRSELVTLHGCCSCL